jgi:hypothetical protein
MRVGHLLKTRYRKDTIPRWIAPRLPLWATLRVSCSNQVLVPTVIVTNLALTSSRGVRQCDRPRHSTALALTAVRACGVSASGFCVGPKPTMWTAQ